MHLFVAERCSISRSFVAEELGHKELRLFDLTEAATLMDMVEIEDACTLVACMRYQNHLCGRVEKCD